MTAFLVTNLHPLVFVLACPVAALAGYVAGLYGLTRAENRAFRRLVAAQQRQRVALSQVEVMGAAFLSEGSRS